MPTRSDAVGCVVVGVMVSPGLYRTGELIEPSVCYYYDAAEPTEYGMPAEQVPAEWRSTDCRRRGVHDAIEGASEGDVVACRRCGAPAELLDALRWGAR